MINQKNEPKIKPKNISKNEPKERFSQVDDLRLIGKSRKSTVFILKKNDRR